MTFKEWQEKHGPNGGEYDIEMQRAGWDGAMAHSQSGKYRDALHIIAHMGISGLSWQHDYEKCVNIAKEALEI